MRIDIEYVAPKVSLTYVSAAVAAYLDFEGWDRRIVDVVLTPDAHRILFEKKAQDSFLSLDAVSLFVMKQVTDDVQMVDQAITRLEFLRTFTDTAQPIEIHSIAFSRPLDDTFSTSDTTAFSATKYLSDAFGLNDSTDVGDGSTYTYTKQIGNVVLTQDFVSQAYNKTAVDTTTISSFGSLVSQNYCDPTYFASDYVGDSRVFT